MSTFAPPPFGQQAARWHRVLASPVALVFMANAGRAACSLAVTLLAARILEPTAFGHFSVFVALAILSFALLGEGFEPGVVRLYARAIAGGPAGIARVMGSALALRALLLIPLAFVFWFASVAWLPQELSLLAPAAALAGVAASLGMLSLSALQSERRFGAYALLAPAANVLRLALVPLLWWAGVLSMGTLVGSYLVAYSAAAVLGVWLLWPRWRAMGFDASVLKELLRFGGWSALASACFMLMAYLQVPLVGRTLGAGAAGVYSVAVTLLMFIDQFTSAVLTVNLAGTSLIDSLEGRREFARRMGPRLGLAAALLAMLYPLLPWLVEWLFGAAYAPAAGLMQVLLPGFLATLMSHPLYLVLYALDKPQLYALSGVIALGAFSVLAAWWLPVHGMLGLAWAGTGARGLQAALILAMVWHSLRDRSPARAAGAGPSSP